MNLIQSLLTLSYIKGVGSITAKKLIEELGSAENVLQASERQLCAINDIGTITAQAIISQKYEATELAVRELNFLQNNEITVLSYMDEKYPAKLKECTDAPLLLFGKGNFEFKNLRILSIVGTRNISKYGKDFIQELVGDLKKYNPLIISGLAYGCDIYAHEAALENDLQTIGVMAHGLNQIYPKDHKRIAMKMMENGGLITEFSSFHSPIRENFLKRNRIVAGIAQATLIVESAAKGGAMTTAQCAFDYNRDVLAVPGRIQDKYSQGCNNLIRENIASLITSAEDLIQLLGWEKKKKTSKPIQKQLFVQLEPTQQLIYDYLAKNGKQSIDILANQLQIPMPRLSVELLNMELKGVVQPLEGKLYEVI